jgi:CubicO group peptidase (beta-lactamase class C family)
MTKSLFRFFALISLVALLIGALPTLPSAAQEDTATPWPTDGWTLSTPEAQGMNSQTLTAMLDQVMEQDINIHGVVVIRHGYLILEAYRQPYAADRRYYIYSCTKSVTSALVGIAIDQGYIESTDQRMIDLLPEYTPANLDDAKSSITLEHLLTMSSGLSWPGGVAEGPILGQMTSNWDWVQFVLDREMDQVPGAQFAYNSGGSNVLAAIVAQATDQPLLDYARANLFDPLGIKDVAWRQDLQGRYLGGWGLEITPRDLAKFGYLYLHNGAWDGQQIISEDWVTRSTSPLVPAQELAESYGYQWWIDGEGHAMALGYGGQALWIYPELDMVAVFTGGLAPQDFATSGELFQSYILPAIESDTPLPENPDAVAALQDAAARLENPITAVPTLPATAQRISGQVYRMDTNSAGLQTLQLNFTAGEAEANLVINGSRTIAIGLDNIFRFSRGRWLLPSLPPGENGLWMKGAWSADERFVMRMQMDPYAEWKEFEFSFNEDGRLQLQVTDNFYSGETFTGTPEVP